MRRYKYSICLVLLFVTFSSCVNFKKLEIGVEKEHITASIVFYEHDIEKTSSFINSYRPWWEEVCKRNNIEQESEYLSDSTIAVSLVIPDYESANNLAQNIANMLAATGNEGVLILNFAKNKNSYALKMDICSGLFTDDGKLFIEAKGAKLTAFPSKKTNYCDVLLIARDQVAFGLTNQNHFDLTPPKNKIMNSFKVEYSYPDNSQSIKNEPVSFISILFKENFWATISSITGTIVSIVTIFGYFRKS